MSKKLNSPYSTVLVQTSSRISFLCEFNRNNKDNDWNDKDTAIQSNTGWESNKYHLCLVSFAKEKATILDNT